MRRRNGLLGLCAMAAIMPLAWSAQAELDRDITARLGHVMPPNHFEHELFLELAADIAERSGGRIQIEVFPASQLGSEREQTEQVDLGALELHSSGGAIQNYAPALGAWALPFIFRGPEHYDAVMDGPIGEEFRDLLLEGSNIRILAYYPNGERMFFSSGEPMTTLADFSGVKIRVDDQPVSAQIWRTLGANPVPLAFAELYTALQTGVVDAGENPLINIIRLKFFEVADKVTLTRHSLTTMALQVNEDWWQDLPEEARDIVEAAIAEWLPKRRQAAWDADREAAAELVALGATVSELENPEEFRAALHPLYEEFGGRIGATEIIARILATE
jgi:TRAP-type transport system periplasmic protein